MRDGGRAQYIPAAVAIIGGHVVGCTLGPGYLGRLRCETITVSGDGPARQDVGANFHASFHRRETKQERLRCEWLVTARTRYRAARRTSLYPKPPRQSRDRPGRSRTQTSPCWIESTAPICASISAAACPQRQPPTVKPSRVTTPQRLPSERANLVIKQAIRLQYPGSGEAIRHDAIVCRRDRWSAPRQTRTTADYGAIHGEFSAKREFQSAPQRASRPCVSLNN